jgi:hypothetical protein
MSVALDPKVRVRLEDEALRENKSMSSVIETVLLAHFSMTKTRPSMWVSNEEAFAADLFKEMETAT